MNPETGEPLSAQEAEDTWVDLNFSEVLGTSKRQPTSEMGKVLHQVWTDQEKWPTLGDIKQFMDKFESYEDMETTPNPKSSEYTDKKLYYLMKKDEILANLCVQFADEPSDQTMLQIVTLLKNSWKDKLEWRRANHAGRARSVLPTRSDNQTPQLLTPDEQKAVQKEKTRLNAAASKHWQTWKKWDFGGAKGKGGGKGNAKGGKGKRFRDLDFNKSHKNGGDKGEPSS